MIHPFREPLDVLYRYIEIRICEMNKIVSILLVGVAPCPVRSLPLGDGHDTVQANRAQFQ
jgi:hypothetical protein